MTAGKELDARIELLVCGPWDESRCRICGWPSYRDITAGCTKESCSLRPAPKRRADEPGPYSTDLEYAFRVVKDSNGWFALTCDQTQKVWTARFQGMEAAVQAETAPLAICLAALKCVGVTIS